MKVLNLASAIASVLSVSLASASSNTWSNAQDSDSSVDSPHRVSDISSDVASVYELNTANSNVSPFISHGDFHAYLLDRFDATEHYSLGPDAESKLEFIEHQHVLRKNVPVLPQLIVSIHGVDTPEEFFSERQPSYTVSDTKSTSTKTLDVILFHNFRRHFLSSHVNYSLVDLTKEMMMYTSEPESTSVRHFRYFNEQLLRIWQSYKSHFSRNSEVDIGFSPSTLNLINDKLFINELSQLVHLSNTKVENNEVVFMTLDSLLSLARKIGHNSSTYNFSKKVLSDYLVKLSEQFDITVVVRKDMGSHHNARLNKRGDELNKVFQSNGMSKRGTVAGTAFYESEDACNAGTSTCSGHGSCVELSSKKWGCSCKPSFDKAKSKTTKWVGYDCGKIDISAEANLFLWSGLALVVFLVGGIQLLFSIGSEPLPGVLDAAILSKKNA
ncbi:predicted protein [Scheffersomyces stipitis CBS 6054]|uniref:Vacuolar sorting protein Vps3844 C-terminal domain-containing protein n=1 Tax=Scheffersomyces stipitis (strain ATCC 58785 / CBS 6054 / NBRC 10063 / NRRL Y-11545) TaxID=322104 RepID=A3LPH6_PICST|nr:predicted protein [Scheffersomyces stipitis CBS 6054]ABN64494.2 predicted protein [Scheffersomyces stipitis CBS 6054]KAG2736778.1 hypothetical protein G9P44_000868 [Scheffersomyces stipitis]